ILLQNARDALPFGRLKSLRRLRNGRLQSPSRLHGNKSALKIDVRRLNSAQDYLCLLVWNGQLVVKLQKVRSNHASMQLDFPFLKAIRQNSHRQEIGDLVTLKVNGLGVGRHNNMECFQPGVLEWPSG